MNHFEQAMQALLQIKYTSVQSQAKTDWVGLFGQKIRVDFLCGDVAYEVKFQEVSGTADQKLVFAVEQIRQCHQIPTYLVLAGTGWGKGALGWGASQPSTDIFLGVLTMDNFLEHLKHV